MNSDIEATRESQRQAAELNLKQMMSKRDKKLLKIELAKTDPFECLSLLRDELNALPAEHRARFLHTNTKALMIAIDAAPAEQTPRLLDAVKSIYETMHGKIGHRMARLSDAKLNTVFARALEGAETPNDFELDVAAYVDMLSLPAKRSLFNAFADKLTGFVGDCLDVANTRTLELVNRIRAGFADVPPEMDALCYDFVTDMANGMSDLATLRTKEAKACLASHIDVLMAAGATWRPTAETQDHRSGTKLVVIFNNGVCSDDTKRPELWVLMSLEEKKIFAVAHAPDKIMSFLSTQMTDDTLPTVETFADEITPLRAYREQALAL